MKQPSQPLSDLAQPSGWPWVPRLAVIVACGGLFAAIWYFGRMQMGGYDFSGLIDTGWRMFSGQVPYKDFFLTTPPGFYLGAWAAMELFGVKWSSFVLITGVFSVATFLLHFLMLRKLLSFYQAWGVAIVCQLLTLVFTAYWWYNPITSISACLFLTAAFVTVKDPASAGSKAYLFITSVLLLAMKPNVACSSLVVVGLILLLRKGCRRWVIPIFAASAICFIAILLLNGINPLDMISVYREIARERGVPSFYWVVEDKEEELFVSIPILLLCLTLLATAVPSRRRVGLPWRSVAGMWWLLGLAGLLEAVLTWTTDSDSGLVVGMPLVFLCGSLLLFARSDQEVRSDESTGKFGSLSVLLSSAALGVGLLLRIYYLDNYKVVNIISVTPAGFLMSSTFVVLSLTALVLILAQAVTRFLDVPLSLAKAQWLAILSQIKLSAIWGLIVLLVGGVALYAGASRWRVMNIDDFYSRTDITLGNLKGLEFFEDFYISPKAVGVVRESLSYLVLRYGPMSAWTPDLPVYFGPRIEFMYAALGIQSPKDLPIWWHPGISFPRELVDKAADSFRQQHFKTCIFYRNPECPNGEFTRIPPQIIKELAMNYDFYQRDNVVIFERK